MKRNGKGMLAVLLAAWMLLSGIVPAAAVETDTPGYILRGSGSAATLTVDIQVDGMAALGGRIAVQYDTQQLRLQNGDSFRAFQLRSNVSAGENYLESEMMVPERGLAGLAWYRTYAVDATHEPVTIATMTFDLLVPESDLTTGSLCLRCLEARELGDWTSAAVAWEYDPGQTLPKTYAYLTDDAQLDVTFDYPGSDVLPADAPTVRFVCRNLNDRPVQAELTVGQKTYRANAQGEIDVTLPRGEYLYRVRAEGYGDQRARLTVNGPQEIALKFVNDGELVAQAAEGLIISFREGDSEKHVTDTIILPRRTESGVDITWESSRPNTILSSGLVYLPEYQGEEVTLKAMLRRGSASATKEFTVYVCSKAELRSDSGGTKPVQFMDLDGYDWARPAIEKLAAAGIIAGKSETAFAPGASITRGEFITILMRMIDPVGVSECTFTDVSRDRYYYGPIAQAQVLGIASGTGDGRFEPNAPISRQDLFTLTIRALRKTGYYPLTEEKNSLDDYRDRAQIGAYALESLQLAVGQGLVVGDGLTIRPQATATRAETAVFMERIYTGRNT